MSFSPRRARRGMLTAQECLQPRLGWCPAFLPDTAAGSTRLPADGAGRRPLPGLSILPAVYFSPTAATPWAKKRRPLCEL